MEWFGLTLYGFPDPIKDMMRPDYKEPTVPPTFAEAAEKENNKSFGDLITQLDCYIGHADGFAYNSYDRLVKMRRKGIFKPVGPYDMYKYPGSNTMTFGFWQKDPLIVGENWYKATSFHPLKSSEMSRYLNKALETDKCFRL